MTSRRLVGNQVQMRRSVALSEQVKAAPPAEPPRRGTERKKYASQGMRDRRRRILTVAQQMLDEGGVASFTIRDLCQRAKVSARAIYYAFDSREDIIACAIDQHLSELRAALPPRAPVTDLEAALRQTQRMADNTVQLQRYAAAMVEVFFSPSADIRIHESLARNSTGSWIARAEAEGVLVRLSSFERESLALLLTNAAYANTGDFVSGRISEKTFRLRGQANILTICYRVLRRKFQPQANRILKRLAAEALQA